MSGPRPLSQQLQQRPASTGGARGARGRASVVADAVGLPASVGEQPSAVGPEVVQRFIKVLLSHDDLAADAFAQQLVERGASAADLYEGLFAHAARELGEMWCADECSFYDVTLGTGRIQRLVREFSHQFLSEYQYPGSAGRILLSCASDEQHSLGTAILAEFFIKDGWDVHIGPGLGSETLLDRVRENQYNLLGFSVSVSSRISRLQQDIRRARQVSRNRDIKVLVGGALITSDPSLTERIGADGFAVDARSAVQEARRLLSA